MVTVGGCDHIAADLTVPASITARGAGFVQYDSGATQGLAPKTRYFPAVEVTVTGPPSVAPPVATVSNQNSLTG